MLQPPFIVSLSGKIGSGKSTFSKFLKEKLVSEGFKVEERNFADKLKKIVFELTGHYGYTQEDKNVFIDEYNLTIGEILQKIGTEVMRNNFDQEVWVKSTFMNLKSDYIYIIGDCRFENEVKATKEKDGIVIRINGDPASIRKQSKRDLNHLSETSLDNYENFDYIFDNKGTLEDMKKFIDYIFQQIFIQKKFLKILR